MSGPTASAPDGSTGPATGPKTPKLSSQPPGGLYDRGADSEGGGLVLGGVVGGIAWLILCGLYGWLAGPEATATPQAIALLVMMVVLPLGGIWLGLSAALSARAAQKQTERLATLVDSMRQAYVAQSQAARSEQVSPVLIKRLDDLAVAQRNVEKTLAMLSTQHLTQGAQPAAAPSRDDDQPALSLGTPAEALEPPLSNADFIRALHFPETAEDTEGFAALRRALKHRAVAKLVQAAQDMLTLLSQDGIYMDDLKPDAARPEHWRAFAKGARGREVSALSGIRDRSSLALSAGRMKQDPIFRDTAHHFLRRFDGCFAEFEAKASDAELTEFANTRTARAFMLLGRVAGTFD